LTIPGAVPGLFMKPPDERTPIQDILTFDMKTYPPISLIQLPFPSQIDPLPLLKHYYNIYAIKFNNFFDKYKLKDGDLWEAPQWIAYLDGAINRSDTTFIDLSKVAFNVEDCVGKICGAVNNSHLLFFSPLAQNLSLAAEISKELLRRGYNTVVGGNMTKLINPYEFSLIYSRPANSNTYNEIVTALRLGLHRIDADDFPRQKYNPFDYKVNYRFLTKFSKRVSLARIHASHGCLFSCSFCGDVWSGQLYNVNFDLLHHELTEIKEAFPGIKLLYIGDKTFGQSKTAIKSLLKLFGNSQDFHLIVQTHTSMVNSWLLNIMEQLQVKAVELGFETACTDELRKVNKPYSSKLSHYTRIFEKMNSYGIKIILNVLKGMPYETKESHKKTLNFLKEMSGVVWLYNLYNFVPYPLAPIFPKIRSRIVDWNFTNWREDRPVVYEPFYLDRQESWKFFLEIVENVSGYLQH